MVKILLVDDEPDIRIITRRFLEKEGYEVLEAEDASSGMDLLEREKPDLVLLDVMMPGKDGWEMCREIKATWEVPVVMFTIRRSPDSVEKSEECGADAQINKPFDKKELIKTVAETLKKD